MAKSKKLEKLGFMKVELSIDPEANGPYRKPRLTFYRSEYSQGITIEFQQHALDAPDALSFKRHVYASDVLALRSTLGDFAEIANIGRRPWSIPYAGKLDDVRVEMLSECESLITLLEWVKKIGGAELYPLVTALREESIPFRVHYGIDPKTDEPIDKWALPDECVGKTQDWAYGVDANEVLAQHYAEQAARLRKRAEQQKQEVA